MKKQYDKKITPAKFIEYIKTNSDKFYTFKLPESEFNEEFINFTKNFFKKHINKCNVKFVISKI